MRHQFYMLLVAAAVITSCGSNREELKQQLLRELHTQFYSEELAKAQAELAVTDSLLQLAEADPDTLNISKRVRLDSLKLEADIQSAKIRYIRKKQ